MNIEQEDYFISNELEQSNKSYIYGEVCSKSFINILNTYYNENKNFIDIGSGCGRLINEISLNTQLFCTGVEIDENRFIKSMKITENQNNIELLKNHFKDIYFGNYDILYCCNLVFEKEENNLLYQKILNEFNGLCFLYNYSKILRPYYKKQYLINTSWQNNVPLYLFIF